MIGKLKLYAIAALVPLLLFAVWQWRAEIQNAAKYAVGFHQLEQAIADQAERTVREREMRAREEALRIELRSELQALRTQQERMAREFQDLERTDEEVADWADSRIPGALLERLLQPGADSGDAD